MNSIYDSELPNAFPFVALISEKHVEEVAAFLTKPKGTISNGSSFAVTSDAPEGYRKLWLSKVSYESLPSHINKILVGQ